MEDFTQTLQDVFRAAEHRLLKHFVPPSMAGAVSDAVGAGASTSASAEGPLQVTVETPMDYNSKKQWMAIQNYRKPVNKKALSKGTGL